MQNWFGTVNRFISVMCSMDFIAVLSPYDASAKIVNAPAAVLSKDSRDCNQMCRLAIAGAGYRGCFSRV
jgi:hypothetical protein